MVNKFTAGPMSLSEVVVLFYLDVCHFYWSRHLFIIVDSIEGMILHPEIICVLFRVRVMAYLDV